MEKQRLKLYARDHSGLGSWCSDCSIWFIYIIATFSCSSCLRFLKREVRMIYASSKYLLSSYYVSGWAMFWMFLWHTLDAVLSKKQVVYCLTSFGLCWFEILLLSWLWITDGHVTTARSSTWHIVGRLNTWRYWKNSAVFGCHFLEARYLRFSLSVLRPVRIARKGQVPEKEDLGYPGSGRGWRLKY